MNPTRFDTIEPSTSTTICGQFISRSVHTVRGTRVRRLQIRDANGELGTVVVPGSLGMPSMAVGTGSDIRITHVEVFDPGSFPTKRIERTSSGTIPHQAMLDVLKPAIARFGIGFLMTDSSEFSVDPC